MGKKEEKPEKTIAETWRRVNSYPLTDDQYLQSNKLHKSAATSTVFGGTAACMVHNVQYWYATSMINLHTLEYMLAIALLFGDGLTLCVTGWPQQCCCVTTGHCVLRVGHSNVVV